jgi:hypothetical protein
MDDSDDDSLLNGANLRPRRTTKAERDAQKKKDRLKSLLDTAVEGADSSAGQRHRLHRLESQQSESVDDEELKRRVEEVAESARKPQFSVSEIASGMQDHEEDGVHDAATKRRLNEALETERIVNYGLRRTINFDSTRDASLLFFSDEDQAIAELLSILKEHESFSSSCAAVIQKLSTSFDKAELLNNLLWTGRFSQLLMPSSTEQHSVDVTKWLFCMACSSRADSNLVHATADVLSDLIKNQKIPSESLSAFDAPGYLTAWCDTTYWPSDVCFGNNEYDSHSDHNLAGLLNLVTLWKQMLEMNENEKIASDDASLTLRALFFIGIDPMIVSPSFSIHLRSAIRALLRLVADKLENSLDPEASLQECAHCLSMDILGPLTDEIKSLRNDSDHGKSTAYLTFPAIIRVAQFQTKQSANGNLLNILLCEMVSQALSTIAKIHPIDVSLVDEALPDPVRKAFSAVIASIDVMISWGADIADEAALALAITDCSTQAVMLGLSFMELPYSVEQKKAIAASLHRIDEQVVKLTRRLNAVGHNDFLRHLDGRWLVFNQFIAQQYTQVTKGSRLSDGTRTPVQRTLKSFLKTDDSP